jgi:hypothetical protein
MSTSAVAIATPEYLDVPDPLYLRRVLRPYKDGCRYLQSAVITVDTARDAAVQAEGVFSIAGSSYIESTGHFNAAEFVMCANQLGYVVISRAIETRGFGILEQQFAGIPPDAFATKQLAGVLILKLESNFRRMIDPRRFTGRIEWHAVKATKRMILLQCSATFTDDAGGLADGSGLIGIVV